ncbi:MAG: lamin tail domain-containing protein [Ignavibacteriaceae bacterium]|nr:lamin tail domain-containing protein [Ignavibacteriaceae bacterium]
MGKCLLLFILSYTYVYTSPQDSCIILSEVMFDAPSGNNEFIELYNRSETQTINLYRFHIKYYTSNPDTIISAGYGTLLPPKSYAVIFEGDYDLSSGIYKNITPSSALKLKISNNAFGSNGMSNTSSRPIWLLNALDDTIDYYTYSANNISGYSDEKISMNKDVSSANWGNSIRYYGTPGSINSLTGKQSDLSIEGISFIPKFPMAGNDVSISALIKNNGILSANNFTVEFNSKTDSTGWKLLSISSGLNLSPGDSLNILSTSTINDIQGKFIISAKINYSSDQDTVNNYFEKEIEPVTSEHSIIINEIMYDPEAGEPEWIELKNISSEKINLKNWSISDLLTTPTKSMITDQDFILFPNDFLIAARDTIFCLFHPELSYRTKIVKYGILGNTEDGIIVSDYRDEIIDSVVYNSSWGHKKGYSLERISQYKYSNDSTNWTLSLSSEKSTPGKENSIKDIPNGTRNDMVINEIMYNPAVGNNEFIELLNLKKYALNIGGWSIEDQHKNRYKISDSNFVIPSNAYFLLAADSSVIKDYGLFGFNNKTVLNVTSLGLTTNELVLLRDLRGNVIDSVYYADDWNNKNFNITKGRSLERINPYLGSNDRYNWNTCVDSKGATPGARNSLYTINTKINSSISVYPNPFSPDNDGFEDCTIINYSLKIPISQVNIKIYDSRGRLVRILANNIASGSIGSVIFDGRGDDGLALRMGIYIIFLEALNSATGQDEAIKSTVVIARKLK